jgi:site-specific recombinase XerD
MYMATCGRSAYTLHSYATGLAHFFGWLGEYGTAADAVTRNTVARYIVAFGGAPKQRLGSRRITQSAAQEDRRRPRTINHRLSVLASYFEFSIKRDTDTGSGPWFQRANPVSGTSIADNFHAAAGRDQPARRKASEFRRRVPREIHRTLDAASAEKIIAAAGSYRDKCILTLLFRTGQRIGDWNDLAGTHGVLGMELSDIDEGRRTITVRLKGNRDQHRVPVTDDFWPLFHRYLAEERGTSCATSAAWVASRKGKGKPLTYAAFESAIRYIGSKAGVDVHAHLFRHTVAQAVLETTGNLKVAQELLGHAQITTTADLYMHVDETAMVKAVATVKTAFDGVVHQTRQTDRSEEVRYAFAYDAITIQELESVLAQTHGETRVTDR